MSEFYIRDYANYTDAGIGFRWRGYTFRPSQNLTITALTLRLYNARGETPRYVAVYNSNVGGDALSLLGHATMDNTITTKQTVSITPISLTAGQWYLLATGDRESAEVLNNNPRSVDYFNVDTVVSSETILSDWGPREDVMPRLFWRYGTENVAFVGEPSALVGESPLALQYGGPDVRPAIGFGYGGFNIWVYKSGAWQPVTDIWARKGGAWQPVSSVDVNKDGWKPI